MQAGNRGHQAVAPVPDALGFPGSQPAPLLFVESAQQ
jgi:hypothetical protein